jgi:hypothetical protein
MMGQKVTLPGMWKSSENIDCDIGNSAENKENKTSTHIYCHLNKLSVHFVFILISGSIQDTKTFC